MININELHCGTITIAAGTPGPVSHPETRITFSDGSSDTYEWSGEINQQTMVDAGLFGVEDEMTWRRQPETVDIGNTVTSIGWSAFEYCGSLTSVMIPDSVTSIGLDAFNCCEGLTSVTIPDSVTLIGMEAFLGCTGLTGSLTIPDSVTLIGEWAFKGCGGLTSVTFNSFTKNEVKSLITSTHIFGEAFTDDEWNPMEKSFTAICTDGSMTVHFSADYDATITFTDL